MMLIFEFLTAVFEATTIFMLVSTYTSEKRRCNMCHDIVRLRSDGPEHLFRMNQNIHMLCHSPQKLYACRTTRLWHSSRFSLQKVLPNWSRNYIQV